MDKKIGPVLLIEDDPDDMQFISDAFHNLKRPNKLLTFKDGLEFLAYLDTTKDQPFIILCNINLHKMNGWEIRDQVASTPHLKQKSIPFIFLTTDTRNESIKKAYDATVQGYIVKESTFDALQENLRMALDYWTMCQLPH